MANVVVVNVLYRGRVSFGTHRVRVGRRAGGSRIVLSIDQQNLSSNVVSALALGDALEGVGEDRNTIAHVGVEFGTGSIGVDRNDFLSVGSYGRVKITAVLKIGEPPVEYEGNWLQARVLGRIIRNVAGGK